MYRRKFEMPSWAKWTILALILIFIAIFIYLIVLYHDIQDSKTKGYSQAEQRVLQETDIVQIEETVRYQGDILYHVVTGKNDDGKNLIVFVPESNDEEVVIVKQNDILPYDTVKANWENDCVNCELIHIVPAIIKNDALWEITYYDESDRYVIGYVSIFDGSTYEEFRFKKMFDK
jgi:uncharacterized protein YpmB